MCIDNKTPLVCMVSMSTTVSGHSDCKAAYTNPHCTWQAAQQNGMHYNSRACVTAVRHVLLTMNIHRLWYMRRYREAHQGQQQGFCSSPLVSSGGSAPSCCAKAHCCRLGPARTCTWDRTTPLQGKPTMQLQYCLLSDYIAAQLLHYAVMCCNFVM